MEIRYVIKDCCRQLYLRGFEFTSETADEASVFLQDAAFMLVRRLYLEGPPSRWLICVPV